jgi:hypothetical protein
MNSIDKRLSKLKSQLEGDTPLFKHRKDNPQFMYWFKAQEGKCAICQDALNQYKVKEQIYIDKRTNEVTGLLCRPCNLGLGHFRDDLVIVQKALDWMKKKKYHGEA